MVIISALTADAKYFAIAREETKEDGFGVDRVSWKAISLPLPLSMAAQDSIARLSAIELSSNFRFRALFCCLNRVKPKIGPRQGVCLGLCT